jgi:hypothetical protein
MDALSHDGPADPARIPSSVCTQPLMPGVNPVTFPADGLHALIDVETSSGDTVTHEPPLACYVTASCPAGGAPLAGARGGPTGCANARRLVFRLPTAGGVRIVAVAVYVDGRRVKRARGRRLRSVRLPPLSSRGVHTIRIVTTTSAGRRHTTVRRYRACTRAVRRSARRRPPASRRGS